MESLLAKIGLFILFAWIVVSCSNGSGGNDDPDPNEGVLQQIVVSPAILTRTAGQSFQFQALGNYSNGAQSDLTNSVSWSVDATSVATVDNSSSKGLVQFLSQGAATLTATYSGLTGQAALTVLDSSASSVPTLLQVSSENPRYFEDAEGNEVLLTGAHTWLNAQDTDVTNPPAAFDFDTWLNSIEQYNHNFFRLWIWEQAAWVVSVPTKMYIQPTPYARTGPGNALDGDLKFDLDQFNQEYFDRVRQRIIAAGQRGMYVSVMLFNGFSVAFPKSDKNSANPWNGHPYNGSNNINGVDGDANNDDSGIESHEIGTVTTYQEQFVKKMIDTVNDLDNVLYEISNESHSGSTAWQYHMIQFIRNYESTLPKQHPIGMTVNWPNGLNSELFASSADWISLNGSLDNPGVADGSKVIIADTDHLCGICGNRQWAWKSFTRGENPIFMDPYDDPYNLTGSDPNDPQFVSLRENLGYLRTYSQRLDLAQAVPCGALASSTNCLGYKTGTQAEFLVYFPDSAAVSLDLSGIGYTLTAEWFNPASASVQSGGSVNGGSAAQSFQSPWSGEAVLYLYKK